MYIIFPQGTLVSVYVCYHLNIAFSTLTVCCYSCCTKSSHLQNRDRSLQTSITARFPQGKLVSIYVCCHLSITFSTLTVYCYSCCTKSSHLQNRNRSLQTSIIARFPQGKLVSIYVCCHLNITFSTLTVYCYSCCTKSSHLQNRNRSLQTSIIARFPEKIKVLSAIAVTKAKPIQSQTNKKTPHLYLCSLLAVCSFGGSHWWSTWPLHWSVYYHSSWVPRSFMASYSTLKETVQRSRGHKPLWRY